MSEGPVYLHCLPVAWHVDGTTMIPGTTELECSECGQPILVAPSGQRLVASKQACAVCVPCGQEMAVEQNMEVSSPTDDQLNELKDTMLREKL